MLAHGISRDSICGCLEFLLSIGQFRDGWRKMVISDSPLWGSIWPSPHIATAARTLYADWLPEHGVLAFPAFLGFSLGYAQSSSCIALVSRQG